MARQTTADETAKTQAEIWAARAKVARELRKTAPPIDVRGFATVQQKVLIKKFADPHGGQDAPKGFHFMFGDRKLGDSYADKGYEPVMHGGNQVHFEGDPMWMIPTELHSQDKQAVVARSEFLLRQRVQDDAKMAKANAASMGEEYERKTVSAAELAETQASG
jgi:hypothetical protein